MRVFVVTCKPYYWSLKPFIYLFQTFWSEQQEVVIAGYEPLPFGLPPNFKFHSIAPVTYPKKKWSNGLREFLSAMPDKHFVWMLEDYFLQRPIDHGAIRTLGEYMDMHDDVLRIDLSSDRLHSGCAHLPHTLGVDDNPEFTYGHYDIIVSDPERQYHMSTQAAIWNRKNLIDVILACEGAGGGMVDPWQFELQGTTILRERFSHLPPSCNLSQRERILGAWRRYQVSRIQFYGR